MDRRQFLAGGAALALGGTAARGQARFSPTRFSAQVIGRGPDVILIPGLTMGRDVWRGLLPALAGYRCHLLQIGGFAGEPVRGNRAGPLLGPLAAELAGYIRARGLRSPALIGHSMGGTLALMVGARHPQLVGRIMVVDMLPAPAGLFGSNPGNLAPLANGLGSLVGTQGGQRLFGSILGAFSPPGSGASRSDPGVVARAMTELAALDLTPSLPAIRAPLTIVHAVLDPRGGPASSRAYQRAYARARDKHFVLIARSGHMVMFDQPERFNTAVRAFLR